jgi:hypothetical protein
MRITQNDVKLHLIDEERRLKESAVRALDRLIADAQDKRAQVIEHGYPTTTMGGAALNGQWFTDSERYLTSLYVIADARALAEQVES